MTFTIHRHSDDIEVTLDGKEYMRVRRKFNWWGILSSEFVMDGRKILKTSFDNSFFRIRVSILDQDLPLRVHLEKKDGRYVMTVAGLEITSTRQPLKNPVRELFIDGRLAARVETDLGPVIGRPTPYRMTILEERSMELYLLLFFLMDLSPGPA